METQLEEWSSLISNTSARHERHKCNTCVTLATWVGHEWHECYTNDTSATLTTRLRHEFYTNDTSLHEWKILILITTWVKIYFHTFIFTIWQVENYKEKEQFHSKSYFFGNISFPCQNAFKKCTTKTKLFNGKSYIKKLYTRL